MCVLSQVNNASLSGLVNDSSQAVISGASVIVKNKSTNVSRKVKTDGTGYYSFPTLPVGDYEVTAEQTGFQTAVEQVTLETAQKARRDFTLAVGQVGTTVEVQSTAVQFSPDDATLGTVIDNSYVSKFPLTLRSWDDLINLVAGVQGHRYTEQSGATSAGRTGGFNVHGVRSLQTNSYWMASITTRFRKTCRN
jgi:hypothetical protein